MSLLLEILYHDHKYFKSVTKTNLSVDNRLGSKSQKHFEYLLNIP